MGLCVLIVAVAMTSIGVTLAETTTIQEYETNVVAIGNVDIKLIDKYYTYQNSPEITPGSAQDPLDDDDDANDYQNGTYWEDNPPVFGPGVTVPKKVAVKNTGENACYVRVLLRKLWYDKNGDLFSTSVINSSITPNINKKYWYQGASVTIAVNEGGVVKNIPYECYYYKDSLTSGTTTEPLFMSFSIFDYSNNMDTYADTTGDIKVLAQAIQYDFINNDPAHPNNVTFSDNIDPDGDGVKSVYVTGWSTDITFE